MGAKLCEGLVVRFAGGVGVGVVVIFGGDEGDLGVEVEEVAVVFVGFVDEILGGWVEVATFGPGEGGADGVADGNA